MYIELDDVLWAIVVTGLPTGTAKREYIQNQFHLKMEQKLYSNFTKNSCVRVCVCTTLGFGGTTTKKHTPYQIFG